MPWFSAITGGLGEQNPYDEIANWSNEAQRRNRQAVGLDANGNPLPTGLDANGNPVAPAAADPNNPVNNGQSAATGTALASGVQQPGQQPNSTKIDPSLGALLMNLTQYQQREQGFNQGMGGAFAAFSQPRDRDWVKAIFNVNEPDPMKIGQQEQDLASQQQGQDRANSIGMIANDPARLTAIAKSLNMDPIALQTLIRSNPAAAGELIKQANIPTATASNASWIGNFGRNNGWSEQDISNAQHLITTGMMPEQVIGMQTAAIAWQKNHPNEPLPWDPNDKGSFDRYQAEQGDISKVHTDALTAKPQTAPLFNDLQNRTEELKTMPGMRELLDMPGDGGAAARQAAQHILSTPGADIYTEGAKQGLSYPVLQFLSAVQQLKGQQYAQAIQQLPNRFSQQEADRLTQSLGQIGNVGMFGPSQALDSTGKPMVDKNGQPVMLKGSDAYTAQAINPLGENVKTFRANNIYGASGSTSDMPSDLRPYMSSDYMTGGKLHTAGATEPWEKTLAAPQPVIDAATKLTKPVSHGGQGYTRAQADRYVRLHGFQPPTNGYGGQ